MTLLARGMAAYAAMQLGRRLEAAMAITIRNKELEAAIREIGRETGEGPSAIIARGIRAIRPERTEETQEERIARRRAAMEKLMADFPPPAEPIPWSEIEREMDAMFDYLYKDTEEDEKRT
jgi:hypothetical protein